MFGPFLPEVEGDERSSDGCKHPASYAHPQQHPAMLPGSPAFVSTQKKLPQAPSPGHSCLAVIFTQQLPAAAPTKGSQGTGTTNQHSCAPGNAFWAFYGKISGFFSSKLNKHGVLLLLSRCELAATQRLTCRLVQGETSPFTTAAQSQGSRAEVQPEGRGSGGRHLTCSKPAAAREKAEVS